MTLNNKELVNITGGAISAALINSIINGFNKLLDFGRTVGTAIRRGRTGQACRI